MLNHIILYDSECIMCSDLVKFVLRHNPSENLLFTPIQSPFALTQKKKFNISPDLDNSIMFIQDDKLYQKSEAVFRITKFLDYPSKLIYYFSFFTIRIINDYFYTLISKNRYRFMGKNESCEIAPDKYKHRFL